MLVTDAELLYAWRGGDRAAGERLFARYFAPVVRFFRNKVTDHLDDLVQQTFAICVEGHRRMRSDTAFRSYLFAVARHVFLEHLRRKYRLAAEVDVEALSLHDLAPGPSQVVAARLEQQVLVDALRRLPTQYQVVLEMYFWEEMTAKELAEALELPLGTVQTRLRRARELLAVAVAAVAAETGWTPPQPLALEEWASALRPSLAGTGA